MLKNLLDKFRWEPTKTYEESALMRTCERLPICFVRGQGSLLWDEDDNQYIDALGGGAVAILGHNHPRICEAISLQANKLLHTSNLFHVKEQAQLARKFCEIAQMEKVFFADSGTQANAAAISIARLHGRSKGIARPIIINARSPAANEPVDAVLNGTHAAMQNGNKPLAGDLIQVEYNDIDVIGAHAGNEDVVAVMIESIESEAGVVIPDKGYLQSLRALCDEHGWLLITDEIQSGMGRTGKWFAYQHEAILPDIMTSAGALGNGIPLGACAARGVAAEVLKPGTQRSSHYGKSLACQVALASIEVIEQEDLVTAAGEMGGYLKKQIQQHIGTHDKVVDIRGKGMMLALEMDHAYANLAKQFLATGLITDVSADGKIVRLLPAINLSHAHAKQIAKIIHDVVIQLK